MPITFVILQASFSMWSFQVRFWFILNPKKVTIFAQFILVSYICIVGINKTTKFDFATFKDSLFNFSHNVIVPNSLFIIFQILYHGYQM